MSFSHGFLLQEARGVFFSHVKLLKLQFWYPPKKFSGQKFWVPKLLKVKITLSVMYVSSETTQEFSWPKRVWVRGLRDYINAFCEGKWQQWTAMGPQRSQCEVKGLDKVRIWRELLVDWSICLMLCLHLFDHFDSRHLFSKMLEATKIAILKLDEDKFLRKQNTEHSNLFKVQKMWKAQMKLQKGEATNSWNWSLVYLGGVSKGRG